MRSKIHLSEDDKRQILYNFDKYGKQWSLISRYTGFKESTIRSFVKQYQKTGQLTQKRGPKPLDPLKVGNPESLDDNPRSSSSSKNNDIQNSSTDSEMNDSPLLGLPPPQPSLFSDPSQLPQSPQLSYPFGFPQDPYQHQNISDPALSQNRNFPLPSLPNSASKPFPDTNFASQQNGQINQIPPMLVPSLTIPPFGQQLQNNALMPQPPNEQESFSMYLSRHLIDSTTMLSFQLKNFREQIDFFLKIIDEMKAQAENIRNSEQSQQYKPMQQMQPPPPLPPTIQIPTLPHPTIPTQPLPPPQSPPQSKSSGIQTPQESFPMPTIFDTQDDHSKSPYQPDPNTLSGGKDTSISRIDRNDSISLPELGQNEVYKILTSVAGVSTLNHRSLILLYNKLFASVAPLTRAEKRNKMALMAKFENQKDTIIPSLLHNANFQMQVKQILAQEKI